MRHAAWTVLLSLLPVAGCDQVFGLERGPTEAGIEAPLPVDGADCFGGNGIGGAGLLEVCRSQLASTMSTLTVTPTSLPFDTDTCVNIVDGLCVIAVEGAINVAPGATLRARGTRPLVLLSFHSITVVGVIDLASSPVGTGAGTYANCFGSTTANPSAGGAGGSFVTSGGHGAAAQSLSGSSPGTVASTVTSVRGGCFGTPGGVGNGTVAPSGPGGGAVYLIAGDSITVNGTITASGGGGAGGPGSAVASAGGGGAGGGSGGLIGLDAPMITLGTASVLVAHGGGGGGGGGGSLNGGTPGTSPLLKTSVPTGGSGATSSPAAGQGGDGAYGAVLAVDGSPSGAGGGAGGGGGGGLGFIGLYGTAITGGVISPPPH